MRRAALGVGLWLFVGVATANCGGNTKESPGSGGSGTGGQAGAGDGGSSGSAGAGGSGGVGGPPGGSSGSAGPPGFSSCTVTTECVVRPQSCCGDCGAALRGDAITISSRSVDAYEAHVCQGGGICRLCYRPSDPTLLARCENGSCVLVDLLASPLTECSTNSDCKLRTRSCCECGSDVSPDALIAIHTSAEIEFQRLTCGGTVGCDDCAPIYPSMARAACRNGRCIVTTTSGTTPI